MTRSTLYRPPNEVAWAHLIPEADWRLYHLVIEAAQARGLRFALGGGFAFSTYTHRWRNTKDIDLYILPADRNEFIELLSAAQFADYYPHLPYDRGWIYRGYREGVIVDLIWAMANRRAETDDVWVSQGLEVHVRGVDVRVIPPEELIWAKLYVVQADRSDWPDLLNLLYARGATLNWAHLLDRLGDDAR